MMVDLETLGTSAKAAVFEIGAVCFDLATREMGPSYVASICLESNAERGRVIEPETLMWWMGQWREAGEVPDLSGMVTVEDMWWEFEQFWGEHMTCDPAAEFWSRGSFDEVILRDIGGGFEGPLPWNFWAVRDQRSVLAFAGVKPGKAGHDALCDAQRQVEDLFRAADLLKGEGGTR
jgi:hypothetical protein